MKGDRQHIGGEMRPEPFGALRCQERQNHDRRHDKAADRDGGDEPRPFPERAPLGLHEVHRVNRSLPDAG